MITTTEISSSQIKSSIFIYGLVLAAFDIFFLLIMKAVNLVHITELRIVNYVVLFLVGFYEMKRLMNEGKNNVSYLQGFGTVFFTGILSSLLFSVFLYFYIKVDTQIEKLFWQNIPIEPTYSFPVPSITIFFEGSAISIIAALAIMQYFRRYEEGEDELFGASSKKAN